MGKAIFGGVRAERERPLYHSIESSPIALLPKKATANESPSQKNKERKILFILT
jgi:hypothetical protein